MDRSQHGGSPESKLALYGVLALILGTSMLAVNLDTVYEQRQTHGLASLPQRLVAGGSTELYVKATTPEGEPQEGVPVKVWLDFNGTQRELWSDRTGPDGVARPQFTVPPETGEGRLWVKVGREEFSNPVSLGSSHRLWLSSDKPLYQPEQTVHLRTLNFDGAGRASAVPVTLEVEAPDGSKVLRKQLAANDFGIASYDYELPRYLPLGNYRFTAAAGDAVAELTVAVQRYVLPRFNIQDTGVKSWYLPDETVEGNLSATYFYGAPVEGEVEVEANLFDGQWQTLTTTTGTLADGNYTYAVDLSSYSYAYNSLYGDQEAYLLVNSTVTDGAGHTETESKLVTLTRNPLKLTVVEDTNVAGLESNYRVVARWPDGSPVVGGQVEYRFAYTSYRQAGTTDDRGVAPLNFTYTEEYNSLRIQVTATRQGRDYEGWLEFPLQGAASGLKLLPAASAYQVGEEARVEVLTSGDLVLSGGFYEVLANGFVMASGPLPIGGPLRFTATNAMVPLVEVRASAPRPDNTLATDSTLLKVGRAEGLSISIAPDAPEYRPGADVTLDFAVTNASGPVAAALGVTIVDNALTELGGRIAGLDQVLALQAQSAGQGDDYQVLAFLAGVENNFPDTGTPVVREQSLTLGAKLFTTGDTHQQEASRLEALARSKVTAGLVLAGVLGFGAVVGWALLHPRSGGWKLLTAVLGLGLLVAPVVVLAVVDSGSYLEQSDNAEAAPFLGGGGGENWAQGVVNKGDIDGEAPPEFLFDTADDVTANEKLFLTRDTTADEAYYNSQSLAKPARLRHYFPETWVWRPSLITDGQGQASLGLVAPDSITSWGVEAVASTQDGQLGAGSANITVFQEFFVEPDLPVEAVRNDTFELPLSVYNYAEANQTIYLTLNASEWFETLSPTQAAVALEAGQAGSASFTIRALEVGTHKLHFEAASTLLADSVERELRVIPNGQASEFLVNGELQDTAEAEITIALDPDRVEGSAEGYVRFQAGMEAVVLEGAEQFIHQVRGCGEQSLSMLSIDILAYQNLLDNPDTVAQAGEFQGLIERGLVHELQYLVTDSDDPGRGIVWFPRDPEPHPWLTSWGLITFADAKRAGFTLDPIIVTDMQKWLLSQQAADGSWTFPEWGLYEFNNPVLKSKTASATAYILRALLYSGYSADDPALEKAAAYLEGQLVPAGDHWDDPYTLALGLLELTDAGGSASSRQVLAARLAELAVIDNDTARWESDSNPYANYDYGSYRVGPGPHTIETTAYALMALGAQGGHTGLVNQAANYLLANRQSLGGWFSTQDTVVAFQALNDYGSVVLEELEVWALVGGQEQFRQTFDADNSDLTYYLDLTDYLTDTTTLELHAAGKGKVLYQVVVTEYLDWAAQGPQTATLDLDLSLNSSVVQVGETLTASLGLTYVGDAEELRMALVELPLPVGLSADLRDLDQLVEEGTVAYYETEPRLVRFYLQALKPNQKYQFQVDLTATLEVETSFQGVRAWDLYNPAQQVTAAPLPLAAQG